MTTKIAVFASGKGSNFQALLTAIQTGTLDAEIGLLVCDRPGAPVVETAQNHGIATFVFASKNYENKTQFEQEIIAALARTQIDWLILAGYMRLLGPLLLSYGGGRIVNSHPSLLPHFPGKDAVDQALAADVKETGVTIHYVDEGMDTGPVIAQTVVPVYEHDDHADLQQRIQEAEHHLYPKTLQHLMNNEAKT